MVKRDVELINEDEHTVDHVDADLDEMAARAEDDVRRYNRQWTQSIIGFVIVCIVRLLVNRVCASLMAYLMDDSSPVASVISKVSIYLGVLNVHCILELAAVLGTVTMLRVHWR